MTTDWISADEAMCWAEESHDFMDAVRLIGERAHEGLIHARAKRLRQGDYAKDDCDVPSAFWRGLSRSHLPQNWTVGDFEGSLNDRDICRAFGVTFRRSDLEACLPPRKSAPTVPAKTLNSGRRPADWWEDLWIEIVRQLYSGDLQPKRQADIETAMSDWLADRDFPAAESTIRVRASKLWAAIGPEAENRRL